MAFRFAHTWVEHRDRVTNRQAVTMLLPGGEEFWPWTEYRTAHEGAWSVDRLRTRAAAVGLFLDFLAARGRDYLSPIGKRGDLFRAFGSALIMGTIEGEEDRSGLYWLPRSRGQASSIIAIVEHFVDWLVIKRGIEPVSPERAATLAEQISFWHRWNHQHRGSLLGHLHKKPDAFAQAMVSRAIGKPSHMPQVVADTKAFPDARFSEFLAKGFARPRKTRWTTYRDQMIALLLHHGGQRVSQPMHLWIDDVFVDPEDETNAVVHIYHPSDGLTDYRDPATGQERSILRSQYLLLRYGAVPLTEEIRSRRVGFKNPLLRDRARYIRVFWNHPEAGRLFLALYYRYLKTRPVVRSHPFLFITEPLNPMTARDYSKVHAAAVRRTGLIPAKNLGTTPHGHRHAYGHWLEARRELLTPKMRQILLAHRSVLSQEVYQEENVAALNQAMSTAMMTVDGTALHNGGLWNALKES